jgi:dihydroflavonol-4-reductase
MRDADALVTGATGFFGGTLARELCQRGARVRVLARAGRRPLALDGLAYDLVEGDLGDEASLATAVSGCRQVYHAAASVTFWCPDRAAVDAVRRVNVDGTRALLRAAKAARVSRLVHVSTVDAIGLPPHGEVADETTDWLPGRIDTVYAVTKREAEHAVLAEADALDVVVVNPTFMIGSYDPRPTSGRLLLPLLSGPAVFYPRRGGNNFIAVRDAVAGTIAAMARGRRGERYILGHANMTYRELLARGLAVLARRPLMVPLPKGMAELAGRLLEAGGRISRAEPALTVPLARLAFADHYYDSSKAIRELGLPQTPIDEALREALVWLRLRSRRDRPAPNEATG